MSEHTLLVILVTALSISGIVAAVVIAAIGWQILKIVQEVRFLAGMLHSTGKAALEDLDELRAQLRAEGSRIRQVADFLLGMIIRKVTPEPRRRKKQDVPPPDEQDA
jgi:hypothetical protein